MSGSRGPSVVPFERDMVMRRYETPLQRWLGRVTVKVESKEVRSAKVG